MEIMKPIWQEIKLTDNEISKIDTLITLEINKLKEKVNNDDIRCQYSSGDISLMYRNIKQYKRILDKLYGREIEHDEEDEYDCNY